MPRPKALPMWSLEIFEDWFQSIGQQNWNEMDERSIGRLRYLEIVLRWVVARSDLTRAFSIVADNEVPF